MILFLREQIKEKKVVVMKNLTFVAGLIALVVGLSAASAALVMVLWNWVMVSIFGLPAISFWLAWGLMILCSFLFKSAARISTKKG